MPRRGTADTDWTQTARPLLDRGGLPLRVAVYQSIAAAIRSGSPGPGAMLPIDADMCDVFRVSRTVMREALILLEEDGLIRTKRGVGRFVVDNPPQIGLEQLQPIEQLLRDHDKPARVRSIRRARESATAFTETGLDLGHEDTTWIWESLILRDGEPIALSQEWTPAGDSLRAIDPKLPDAISSSTRVKRSLLTVLLDTLGPALGPASCEVAVSTAGPERGDLFSARGDEPILLLSQHVLLAGQLLYVAKHMLRAEAGHVLVAQTVPL